MVTVLRIREIWPTPLCILRPLYVVMTAVQGIFVVALYRYATGKSDGGFDSALLKDVFT
jgi:hypothetical protein